MFSIGFYYNWMHLHFRESHSKASKPGHLLKYYSKWLGWHQTEIWSTRDVVADIGIF